MWKLVIEDDEGKRTVVPLTRDDYTLGRREGNTIRLTERNVSRDHGLLRKKLNGGATAFTLHDCSSYNGVYVNGVRVIDGQDLQHGDLIQIGDYRLILQDDTIQDQPAQPGATAEDGKTTLPLGVTRGSLLLERPNRLVMLAGPMPGSEYPLTLERMTIGRAEDATISVNHNSVSRMHCEIHALGESRFEIVDKGSSNGVRVNGADLRRGIIEAGDIIELGDVRFKFVGAGQVFVPGVTESAQLEAISDRAANAALRQTTSPKAVWFLVLSVVALLIVGAWAALRTPTPDAPKADIPAPDSAETVAISDATKLCAAGDCEHAHERLQQGVAISSPLRDSDTFKMIEGSWAQGRLTRADTEQDPKAKRALLEPVRSSTSVDTKFRKEAADRLQALDAIPPTTITSGSAPQGLAPATSTPVGMQAATPASVQKTPKPEHSTAKPPTPPTTTPPPSSGGGSVMEKVRPLILSNPQAAKDMLVPRVFGGKATREEIEALKAVCKDLRDSVCVSKCKDLLAAP
jgi:pSer/pThr/pTyr-binding forkhead associated (FHA) protein